MELKNLRLKRVKTGAKMEFRSFYGGYHPMVDYMNAMDPQMYQEPGEPVDMGIQDIGMSVPLGISAANVQGLYSKIRMGAKHMEIGFPGMIGGSRNAQTPEMYGEDQRQAIRELAAINEVTLTTHAAYNVMGLSGMDQGGNFSLARARQARAEIERAIDFAADTAGGGPVVVHTGEFERPLTHIYPTLDPAHGVAGHFTDIHGRHLQNYARDPATGRLLFQRKETEAGQYEFLLMDDRTGQAYHQVQADRFVAVPEWRRSKHDYSYYDPEKKQAVHVKKGDYINYQNRLIEDPYDIEFERKKYKEPWRVSTGGRVPEYDPNTGRFKTRLMSVEDFGKEAEEYNKWFEWKIGRRPSYYERQTAQEMMLKATLMTNAGHSRGWALQYAQDVEQQIEKLNKLEEVKKFYEKLDKSLPEEEKWKIMRQDTFLSRISEGLIPVETKHPLEMVEKEIRETKKRLEFAQQASTSQELQAEDTTETMRHLITPEKYVVKNVAKEYAIAAIHAMEKTRDPRNPVNIAIEHIFPERFGGHPEELKNLIKEVRRQFADLVTSPMVEEGGIAGEALERKRPNPYHKPDLSREEAERLAEQHVKATFDTAHLNLWRKYWINDSKKSAEQNEAEFKNWYLQQVETLAKEGLIGNVHLADNFGYQDDHLSPGQGNAPIREAVGILKKYGYDGTFTVEPGADASTDSSDFHGLMKTWRYFGSPIYGAGPRVGAPQHWGQIQYSYFGQTFPPNYIFGGYAPSNDWTLWTAIPLE